MSVKPYVEDEQLHLPDVAFRHTTNRVPLNFTRPSQQQFL